LVQMLELPTTIKSPGATSTKVIVKGMPPRLVILPEMIAVS